MRNILSKSYAYASNFLTVGKWERMASNETAFYKTLETKSLKAWTEQHVPHLPRFFGVMMNLLDTMKNRTWRGNANCFDNFQACQTSREEWDPDRRFVLQDHSLVKHLILPPTLMFTISSEWIHACFGFLLLTPCQHPKDTSSVCAAPCQAVLCQGKIRSPTAWECTVWRFPMGVTSWAAGVVSTAHKCVAWAWTPERKYNLRNPDSGFMNYHSFKVKNSCSIFFLAEQKGMHRVPTNTF